MDLAHIHATILLVALAIWAVPEWIGSYFQRPERGAVRRDRGSHRFLIAAITIGIAGAFVAATRAPWAAITIHRDTVFWVGIASMLAGVAFRWYAIRSLGRYFTRDVATRPGQQVIESGPYRWIRHPSYSGALLTIVGLGLALTNWMALAVAISCGLIGYGYRVRIEERALCEDLGEPYCSYMHRTRRFIPFVW